MLNSSAALNKLSVKKDPPEGGPKMRVNAFLRRDSFILISHALVR